VCFSADGLRCFLYEIYEDAAAFELHKREPHFLRFDEQTRPLVKAKRVETYWLVAPQA
jgi:(4S)-4-hydroxy-5-phosphonooxypentane-2,3-dione isomerase